MSVIDETHDPRRQSWVASAQGHAEFPIQNLPFGIFSLAGGTPRGGVAIGDMVFDLRAGVETGLFTGEAARAAEAASGTARNPLMAIGSGTRDVRRDMADSRGREAATHRARRRLARLGARSYGGNGEELRPTG